MSFDDYFTHDDKPFAENLNDALLLSNVFDFTVPIELPTMFSNSTWTNTTSERKAGVSIVKLNNTLPSGLSITTVNSKSAITGTGTMQIMFYPNFNSFGKFIAFNWTSSNNKITVNLKTKTGTTILSNISKGNLSTIPAGLQTLDTIMIELVFTASDTLTSFTVTMQNKEQTRYGAEVGIDNVNGLENRLTSIESKNTSQDTAINGKVDKETGKGLFSGSYNDLTNKPSTFTPSSHTHGNLTNDGKVSNTSSAVMQYFTGVGVTSNSLFKSDKLTSDAIIDTTAHSNIGSAANANQSNINSNIDTALSNKAASSHTHGNLTNAGKIGSASDKIIVTGTGGALQAADTITKSKISDFPTSMTPSSHTHGNLTNAGAIGSSSGKIITTTTNGVLQASSTITKSKISDFPTEMTPSSHTHGNLTNDGKIGSASGKIIVTGTSGVLQAADSITKSKISDFPTSMTPTSHTHGALTNDGKIGSSSGYIITTTTGGALQASATITKSKISDFPTSMTPTSHTHGNISNAGAIGSASGKLVVTGTSGVLQAADTITKSKISDFSHTHGSVTNDGKIGSTSGKIITTGTNGVLQASSTITKDKISDFAHNHDDRYWTVNKTQTWYEATSTSTLVSPYTTIYINPTIRLVDFRYYRTDYTFLDSTTQTLWTGSSLAVSIVEDGETVYYNITPVMNTPLATFNAQMGGGIALVETGMQIQAYSLQTGSRTIHLRGMWHY